MKLPWKRKAKAPKVLVNWVKNAVKEGYTNNEIHDNLGEAGYTKDEVEKALATIERDEPIPQELLDWLKNALKEGYSPEEVREHLESAGYKSKQIKQALEHEEVRRASSVWVGEDSSPKFKLPRVTYILAVAAVLVLIVGVAVLSQIPQTVTLWPSALAVDATLSHDSPVPVTQENSLSLVLGFRRGEKHTLIVMASAPQGARLGVEVDSGEIGSAQITSSSPEQHTFTFTPLSETGRLTVRGEGELFIHTIEFKRSRKLLG